MVDPQNTQKGWPWRKVLGKQRQVWMEPSADLIPFVSRLKQDKRQRVYDLGCGIGRHTVYLAREGFEVWASDAAPDGLEETRRLLEAEGLRAEVTASDLTSIQYPDEHFDAVIAVNVVYHAIRKDVETCLSEVHRTLRSGGLFFVTFNSIHSDDWGHGRQIDENTFVKIGGIEDGIPHYFVDRQELECLMAGFEVLRLSHKDEWNPEIGKNSRSSHWVVWGKKF